MPIDADAYEECASCKHYPAYHEHPGDSGAHPCRAWDPDAPDSECPCAAWKKPQPKPTTVLDFSQPLP